MPKSIQTAGEAMPKIKILAFPADAGAVQEQREAVLTDLIADMVRMSSVLSTLLEDRIRDTGKGPLTIARKDAADIQFVAGQAAAYAERIVAAWEAI